MHVDGDSFFASCEVAKDPNLRGKPVITGKERGIVSSMTYEARALGVRRAMPLHEIKKKFPEVIIVPSDYETYSIFSNRMYEIVRRYTPAVEEYSIDECFADLTGLRSLHHMPYPDIAATIKRDLERELGMTFSMGLSATKVLAKIGSKWNKPAGLTVIPLPEARPYLEQTPVGKIWGIGPNTAAYLQKLGIMTAFDFAQKSEIWVSETLSKPYRALWNELNGKAVNELVTEARASYQSIQKTRTFTPSRDPRVILSQLSKNVENACIKARRWHLATRDISFFLKTQEFKYHGYEIRLSHSTCVPQDILKVVTEYFPRVFRQGTLYRTTGITLAKLHDAGATQLDLFGAALTSEGLKKIFEHVDSLCERYGKHALFLGSSFGAMTSDAPASTRAGSSTRGGHKGERGDKPERMRELFKGETARRRLGIPSLGEVN
jgi:DNA polymerase-4/DNA polymerase V